MGRRSREYSKVSTIKAAHVERSSYEAGNTHDTCVVRVAYIISLRFQKEISNTDILPLSVSKDLFSFSSVVVVSPRCQAWHSFLTPRGKQHQA